MRSGRSKKYCSSIRKYSCSGPTVVKMRWAVMSPNRRSARIADFDSASIERNSGIFWSSASPVQDANAVGMQSSAPFGFSRMKAGDDGSQAVYPRASKVARIPPVGNEDARSEEHTSELQSRQYLVCRLLLEKKKKDNMHWL